ncbi:DUF3152 domain-containing protein [Streptomyces erythrochromogenes]|uniref:DUF3152 domain-containing protein n=1 Tax=Streptomyces erythrochromogenes TaxID=285574 RepID=UPI00341C1D0D
MGHRTAGPTRTEMRRRRKQRTRAVTVVAALGCAGAGTAVALLTSSPQPPARATLAEPTGTAPASAPAPPPPPPPSPSPSPTPSPDPTPSPAAIPDTGPGTFTVAAARGQAQGQGRIRRYRVEIEDGIRLPGPQTAQEVAAILGHARGWTKNPAYGFQLVSSGPVDFTVKVATPGTTDRLCDVTTPASRGNVNCRTGHTVVVNLKRWVQGSPRFDGPLAEYRALIINHEVGHEIGRGHESCAGPGALAPAMMQQIKGLEGCLPNAWPYDTAGRYVQGPAVP